MNEAAYSSPDTDQVFADAAQEGLIRPASAGEIDRMVDIWLSASIQAHNFISSDFWHKGAEDMRQKYLPTSENWVYCEGSRIIGFFSLQQNSLVALFVAPGRQNRGIGTLLLHKARQLRQSLSLTVYEENRNAIDFYCHHGFKVMIAQKDPHTGHSELLMEYSET
ncbi:MAG TPA: GNAT family N-acetyltransferase [Candidatus Riflebacteria bacterium]|nr:GNAT family N-acetyltransferase [Candidatus Riflebacteria bacterium]